MATDTPLSPSLLNPGQRSPLNFTVTCLDDLLIWADLWIDYNEPLYADACRWAHKFKRWPRKYRKRVEHSHQYKWNVYGGISNSHFEIDKYVIRFNEANLPCFISSNTTRWYSYITLAYLDLFNHMVSNPVAFLEQLNSSPS